MTKQEAGQAIEPVFIVQGKLDAQGAGQDDPLAWFAGEGVGLPDGMHVRQGWRLRLMPSLSDTVPLSGARVRREARLRAQREKEQADEQAAALEQAKARVAKKDRRGLLRTLRERALDTADTIAALRRVRGQAGDAVEGNVRAAARAARQAQDGRDVAANQDKAKQGGAA